MKNEVDKYRDKIDALHLELGSCADKIEAANEVNKRISNKCESWCTNIILNQNIAYNMGLIAAFSYVQANLGDILNES